MACRRALSKERFAKFAEMLGDDGTPADFFIEVLVDEDCPGIALKPDDERTLVRLC